MASLEKRCHYDILGLRRDCTADEIRSAYKKLALQRHPDKMVQSGVSQADATASFQELVSAYEVLSDHRERAWYDSHRSQILFSNPNPSNSNSNSNSTTVIPDLFSFFSNSVFSGYSDTGKGFYKVYGDIFDKIYQTELNFAKKLGLGLGSVREAPLMGNLENPYSQVNAFYSYWVGFATVMDFVWVDQYDAMAGPNRKSRRVMEEENKKLRKKVRREYNETVRGLAEFVKKRDKRVIDMQVKRSEEMERKREEEKERKRQMERERAERARAYEEPEWAKVEEAEDGGEEVVEEGERKKELYCVLCGKKFKSEKQWKNHEQSKKHKEKAAELREALSDEERENEEEGLIDELHKQFENCVGTQEKDHDADHEGQSSERREFVDIDNVGKSRKPKASSTKIQAEVDRDEMDFREYNNSKGARRKRGGRKERGKRADEEAAEINSQAEENNGHDDGSHMEEEESSHFVAENGANGKGDDGSEKNHKVPKQALDKKGTPEKEANTKSKNASRGRKQKV